MSPRHRRCRLKIITSLLLPPPEEVWEPYCSRKPSLTPSFFLVSLCPTPYASRSPCRAFIRVRLLPRSSLLLLAFLLPPYPLCGFLSTGWRATCRARATEFRANSMEIARVSEIASTERILRRRMSRQTSPFFVVTLNISISIHFIGRIFPPSFSKLLPQNIPEFRSIILIEWLVLCIFR